MSYIRKGLLFKNKILLCQYNTNINLILWIFWIICTIIFRVTIIYYKIRVVILNVFTDFWSIYL